MQHYIVNRPDPDAMEAALQAHNLDMVGTVLRLAWWAGLSRGELLALEWGQVHFLDQVLTVDGRRIPMSSPLYTYLITLEETAPPHQPLVVLGNGKQRKPPAAQAVSRQVRDVLDGYGQTAVRLVDLRHDYILRLLQSHDWQTVCRYTGVSLVTLQTHFAPYLPEKSLSGKAQAPHQGVDEIALHQVLDAQGASPQGMALRLAWWAGMGRREMAGLTWAAFDLKKGVFTATGAPMDAQLLAFFRGLPPQSGDTLVMRGPVSGGAMLADRLSRLCRGALVQGGLDDCSLQTLRQDYQLRQGGQDAVLAWVAAHGSITTAHAQSLLALDAPSAYARLRQWVSHGKLVQQGRRYYLPHAIVPPAQQAHAVVEYLQSNTMAYRKDLADLLGLPPQQCSVLLKKLVTQGLIRQDKQRYMLP